MENIMTYENLSSQIIEALDEIFKYSDEQIEQVKEQYYYSLEESYASESAYEMILEQIKAYEKEGFTKQEMIEECENGKIFLDSIFDQVREKYQDSSVKLEVIDYVQECVTAYLNAFILQVTHQENPNVFIELIHPNAKVPSYAHPGDQGADVYAVEDVTLEPHSYGNLIPTGLRMQIPEGWAISIRPRSGLSKNSTLRISNSPATIDTNYRGEVKVLIDNIGNEPVAINTGERIAQMLIERNYQMNIEVVNSVTSNTDRGVGGFGSSGN